MGHPAARTDERFTYGDYVKWPEEERWELIDGVAYDMTPAPSTLHQRVLRRLLLAIAPFLEGKRCEVFAAPFDVRLPDARESDEEVQTVVQPDLSVVCDRRKLDEKGCRGAPDFVVEIASPSTARKDLIKKKEIYERHGVREYWLVHPTDRIVTMWLLGDDGRYSSPRFIDGCGRVEVATLPGLDIDLDAVFAPVEEQDGREP